MESRSVRRYRNPGPKKKPRGKPFAKGNKYGGRNKLDPDVKAAFQGLFPDAVKALTEIVRAKKHSRREQAAEYITNRVGGLPTSSHEVSGPNGQPLQTGPLQVSVSFCTTPLSLGKAQVTHIGPNGQPLESPQPLNSNSGSEDS